MISMLCIPFCHTMRMFNKIFYLSKINDILTLEKVSPILLRKRLTIRERTRSTLYKFIIFSVKKYLLNIII